MFDTQVTLVICGGCVPANRRVYRKRVKWEPYNNLASQFFDAELIICITLLDKPGEDSMHVTGFKIWPRIGYWYSSWHWNKNRRYAKTRIPKARVTRVACILKVAFSTVSCVGPACTGVFHSFRKRDGHCAFVSDSRWWIFNRTCSRMLPNHMSTCGNIPLVAPSSAGSHKAADQSGVLNTLCTQFCSSAAKTSFNSLPSLQPSVIMRHKSFLINSCT
jgi:hypothetical protein